MLREVDLIAAQRWSCGQEGFQITGLGRVIINPDFITDQR